MSNSKKGIFSQQNPTSDDFNNLRFSKDDKYVPLWNSRNSAQKKTLEPPEVAPFDEEPKIIYSTNNDPVPNVFLKYMGKNL